MSQEQLIKQLVALTRAVEQQRLDGRHAQPAPPAQPAQAPGVTPDLLQQLMQQRMQEALSSPGTLNSPPSTPEQSDDRFAELEAKFATILQQMSEQVTRLFSSLDARIKELEATGPAPASHGSPRPNDINSLVGEMMNHVVSGQVFIASDMNGFVQQFAQQFSGANVSSESIETWTRDLEATMHRFPGGRPPSLPNDDIVMPPIAPAEFRDIPKGGGKKSKKKNKKRNKGEPD